VSPVTVRVVFNQTYMVGASVFRLQLVRLPPFCQLYFLYSTSPMAILSAVIPTLVDTSFNVFSSTVILSITVVTSLTVTLYNHFDFSSYFIYYHFVYNNFIYNSNNSYLSTIILSHHFNYSTNFFYSHFVVQ